MAKKSKKNSSVDDALEVEAEANPIDEIIEDAAEEVEEQVEDLQETEDSIPDAEVLADEPLEIVEHEIDAPESVQDFAEDTTVEAAQPEPVAAAPEPRKGGFFPMLLGGLVAGGIGYGVSYLQWGNTSDLDGAVAEQAQAIAELKEQIASLPEPVDIAPLEGQVSEISSALTPLSEGVETLTAASEAATQRIDALERRPNADGTLADTALAAFEADMEGLREQLTAQQTEMETMVATAAEQLQATRDEAVSIEQTAVATARKATARTVLAQLQTQLDSGAPIGALLSDLEGALDEPLPEALSNVSDGAPTLSELQEGFAPQASAALSVARSEGVSGEESSALGSFLRNQLEARSTAPKEGTSVDAILSRVEGNLKSGQLNDALAEVAALPEVARGAMSDWIGQAELRASALDAIAQLSDTLNLN